MNVLVCPTCKSEEKVTKRCLECGRFCCSGCSINRICIDCYIKAARMDLAYKKEVLI